MHIERERRKYQRVEKPVIIIFRTRSENDHKIASSEWDMLGGNDLRVGGLFFNSSNNVQDGTVLDLKIGVSTSSSPVECTGIVTRVKEQANTSIFGVLLQHLWILQRERVNK